MQHDYKVENLSSHLFWDTPKEEVDWDSNKSLIIIRVLEGGNLSDWQIIKEIYGLEKINEAAKKVRSLNAVSLNFISFITNTPINEYRCYTEKQLNPTLWNS